MLAAQETPKFSSVPEKQVVPSDTGWEKGQVLSKTGLFPPSLYFDSCCGRARPQPILWLSPERGLMGVLPPPSVITLFLQYFPSCLSSSLSSLGVSWDTSPWIPPLAACIFTGLG